MPVINKEGSVRVDLVGGTLDIDPINLILKDVVTLNVATSLKALVKLEEISADEIIIESLDYQSTSTFSASEFTYENLRENDHFGPLKFFCQILDYFNIHRGLKITSSSGAPAGSGLGGSSAMGVTLFSALAEYSKKSFTKEEIIWITKGIESRILNQGETGYQDYYPALFGGILAYHPSPGKIKCEQLFSEECKKVLESQITLIFSGKTRLSGMNNWEMYKSFFDKDEKICQGLQEIARISQETYQALKQESYQKIISLIGQEGDQRKNLFPGINSKEMDSFYDTMKKKLPTAGMKVCGAGGGGCFIVAHEPGDKVSVLELIEEFNMQELDFCIEVPI